MKQQLKKILLIAIKPVVLKHIIRYSIRVFILIWFLTMAYKETGLYTILLLIMIFVDLELIDISDRLQRKRIDLIPEVNIQRDQLVNEIVNIIRINMDTEDLKKINKDPYSVN